MKAPTKPLAIIIADDFPELRQLLAEWLRGHGHRVACASSGEEALKMLENEYFDLVITDVMMPDGDGIDLIRELKLGRSTSRTLVITGGGKYVPAADCVKIAQSVGADAALLKPFDEAQLLKAIDRAFSTQRSTIG